MLIPCVYIYSSSTHNQLMAAPGPYEILQISEQASGDEIRERYLLMSRTFHPDKQPLENYNLTKRYFESIDRAYKSISTTLRKYIYFKFGMEGIDLIERFPDDFVTLEGKEDTPEGRNEIDELMFHFYFSDRRDYFDDLGRVEAFTILDISPLFVVYAPNVLPPNYRVPLITKINAAYMLAGPTFLGFQNNVVFGIDSTKQRRTIESKIMSTRRLFGALLFRNVLSYGSDGLQEQAGLDFNYSSTLVLRMTPLIYEGGDFYIPKVGFDKRFESGLQITAETNLYSTTFEVFMPGKEATSTNSNLSMTYREGVMSAHANFDNYLSQFCRFMVDVHTEFSEGQVDFGVSYGITSDFGDDLKIEMISHWTKENYLDVRVVYGKYSIRIPVICTTLNALEFEGLKISSMLVFYTLSRMHTHFRRSGGLKKEKLRVKSYARLNDEKSKQERSVHEIRLLEEEILSFEYSTQGLVILAAYVGSSKEIYQISRRVGNKNLNLEAAPVEDVRIKLEFDEYKQVVNVTKKVQTLVKGARINSKTLNVYNPCFDQTEQNVLLIYYSLRGETKTIIQKSTKPINIGQDGRTYDNFLSRTLDWLRKVHLLP